MIHDEKSASTKASTNALSPFVTQAALGQADRHIEIGKTTHDGMIAGTQEIFDRWCARRRQSADALATLGREALAAKSPQDVLQVWVQWTKGAMDRLLEDAKDQMAAGASAARHVANGTTAMALYWTPGGDAGSATATERLNGDGAAQKKQVRH